MKISRNWLNNYIVSNKSNEVLVDSFTNLGLACTVNEFKINFNNIVVGKVIKCIQHPNADKLKICEVNIGTEVISIICGAPNIKSNINVPVAKIGAVIGDSKIKKQRLEVIFLME